MRFLLMLTALVLSALIALQFVGESNAARPFENMTVVVLHGHEEFSNADEAIEDGARLAERELGCTVYMRPVAWRTEQTVATFQQVMSAVPDGIVVMGYPAQAELTDDIQDALDEEIVVTSVNTPFIEAEKIYGRTGFGFAGINGYDAGKALIKAAIRKHNLIAGTTMLLIGDYEHPARLPFCNGCRDACTEAGITVEAINPGFIEDDQHRDDIVKLLVLRRNSGTLPDLVCFTEQPLVWAAGCLRDAGLEAGEVPLVGIAMAPDSNRTPRNLRRGYVSLFVSQDIRLQTYLAVLQTCMGKAYGVTGLHIDTPFEIVQRIDFPDSQRDEPAGPFVQRY